MKQTKLVNGLGFLSKEEWKSFKKYILMYSTTKSDQYKLVDIISKKWEDLDQLQTKELFRKSHFTTMSSKSFLNLCSRVFQIFEEWLLWYEMKKDKDRCDSYLVKVYNRRGMFTLADKKYNAITKRINEIDQLTFEKSKLLNDIYHYHHFSENPAKNTIGGSLLKQAVTHWHNSYKEQSILYILEMSQWGVAINYDYSKDISLLRNLITQLPKTNISILLQHLYRSYADKDHNSLVIIYNILSKGEIKVGSDLETLITLYSIAFSSRNWTDGISEDTQLISDFYEYALSSSIILKLGKISCHRFLNIISVVVHSKSIKYCYEFIDNWAHLIGDQDLESAKNICYVYPKLKSDEYEDIILLLRGRKYNSIYLQLRAMGFENMALYKTKEWDILRNRLQNHKRKLRGAKNKIPKKLYNGQISFISILGILSKSHFSKVDPINLSNYPTIFNKAWIKEEIKSRGLDQLSAF